MPFELHLYQAGNDVSTRDLDDRANLHSECFVRSAMEAQLNNDRTYAFDTVHSQAGLIHTQHGEQNYVITPPAPTGFNFVSGCRPLGAQPAAVSLTEGSGSNSNPEAPSKIDGRRCDFPGCRSKKTFKRNYELQRHRKKHDRAETFDCPAVNCKYRGSKAFYRPDKLKAHVDAAHDENTMFACPIAGCLSARTAVSRNILALHIRNHDHGACKPYWSHFKALENCDKSRSCPVEGCTQKLDIDSLQEHIMQHGEDERKASHIGITIGGFDPSTAFITCPFLDCQIRSQNLTAFHGHINEHTISDIDHFTAWRDGISPRMTDNSAPWQIWVIARADSNIVCPICNTNAEFEWDSLRRSVSHQLSLLKPPKELYQYREQILSLYPDFSTHPVFDDVMPAIHRKTERVP
ncbi:hypothetical protein AOQ84DRAFT_30485 [Glonium stellatum]|uniref:C2H2-type domain-containing protein n=1 Tax=Glonium stellatum TaxID=574774 RepID=A0A8E2F2A1_9PEZI|nr:hypothetical protein AOQ84DRAFT_30485 [Glonium stellatum]